MERKHFGFVKSWETAVRNNELGRAMQILEMTRKTRSGSTEMLQQIMGEHVRIAEALGCASQKRFNEARGLLQDLPDHLCQAIIRIIDTQQATYEATRVKIAAPPPPVAACKTTEEPVRFTKPEIIPEEPAVEAAASLVMEEKVTKPLLVPEPSAKIQEEVVLPDPSPSPAPLPLPPRESVSPKRVKAPSAIKLAQKKSQTSSHVPPAVLIPEYLDAKDRRWNDALEQFTAFLSSVSDEGSTSTATRKRLLGLLIERGPNAVPMEDIQTHLWPNPKTSAKNPVDAVAQLVSTLNHCRGHAPLPGTIVFSPMGYKLLPQEIPDVMEGEERLLTLARDFLSRLVNNQRLLMNVLWRKRGSIVRHEEICLEIWDDPAPSSQRKMRITDAAFNLKENLSQHELGQHGEIRTKKGQGYGFFLT